MPLGLFALVAVGVHAGADAVDDWLLAAFDWLDGYLDRGLAALLIAVGELTGAATATSDRWAFAATSFVDLRERALMARWGAVVLELLVDVGLALPALGYRERERTAAALDARVEAILAARGKPPAVRQDLREMLRAVRHDPTLLRLLLPTATAFAAVAGASRVASEVQATVFASISSLTSAGVAGPAARFAAIFVLCGIIVSLGTRATAQALFWAHQRAESDKREVLTPFSRRTRGIVRLAFGFPMACAALITAPLLSFFR